MKIILLAVALLSAFLILRGISNMAYRKSVTIAVDQSNSGYVRSSVIGVPNGLDEARKGTAIATIELDPYANGLYNVGHQIVADPSFDYYVDVTGLSSSLASIPAGAVIKDVKLSINTAFNSGTTSYTDILLVQYDWGSGTLAVGDFIDLDTLNDPVTYPILGSRNSQFIFFPPARDQSFLANKAMIEYIQTQFDNGNPARFWLVSADTLYNNQPDFYIRERKGLSVITPAQEESKSYQFDPADITFTITLIIS